jgi:hypothetical protein
MTGEAFPRCCRCYMRKPRSHFYHLGARLGDESICKPCMHDGGQLLPTVSRRTTQNLVSVFAEIDRIRTGQDVERP